MSKTRLNNWLPAPLDATPCVFSEGSKLKRKKYREQTHQKVVCYFFSLPESSVLTEQ